VKHRTEPIPWGTFQHQFFSQNFGSRSTQSAIDCASFQKTIAETQISSTQNTRKIQNSRVREVKTVCRSIGLPISQTLFNSVSTEIAAPGDIQSKRRKINCNTFGKCNW
jgi:hypothetical protein